MYAAPSLGSAALLKPRMDGDTAIAATVGTAMFATENTDAISVRVNEYLWIS